jgi:hypothetical protein
MTNETLRLRVSFAQGALKGTVRAVIDTLQGEPWSGRDTFCISELERALEGLEQAERDAGIK